MDRQQWTRHAALSLAGFFIVLVNLLIDAGSTGHAVVGAVLAVLFLTYSGYCWKRSRASGTR